MSYEETTDNEISGLSNLNKNNPNDFNALNAVVLRAASSECFSANNLYQLSPVTPTSLFHRTLPPCAYGYGQYASLFEKP